MMVFVIFSSAISPVNVGDLAPLGMASPLYTPLPLFSSPAYV
jgi:hypothetical protein